MVVNVCHHDFLGQGIHLGLEWSRLFGFSQPRGRMPMLVILPVSFSILLPTIVYLVSR